MDQIELSEFIRNALVQIAKGVHDANGELKDPDNNKWDVYSLRHNKGDSSKVPGIKFDVAVTAASSRKDKSGFFVTLVNFGAGANTEKSDGGQMVHRIQFEVGVESTWL